MRDSDIKPVALANTANLDAFARLRVSNPVTLFDSQNQYSKNDLQWTEKFTGLSTSVHVPNKSSVLLSAGNVLNDSVIRQTKSYFRYQPGKSQLIFMTFSMVDVTAANLSRVGYFDGENGVFLENNAGVLSFVVRSKTSGVAVDNRITQDLWNIDTFDGTDDSGIVLDISKAQIIVIDLEWLSVGRVRVGFCIDGMIYYAHHFNHANNLDCPYMTTANLPARYEITNTTGATGGDLLAICCSIISEGGFEVSRGNNFAANSGAAALSAADGVLRPIMSLRLAPSLNGIQARGVIELLTSSVLAAANIAEISIIYNGTLTGAAFVSANDESIAEHDHAATAITGGYVIDTGFVPADNKNVSSASAEMRTKLPLSRDIDGNNPDVITVCAAGVGGISDIRASFTWREER